MLSAGAGWKGVLRAEGKGGRGIPPLPLSRSQPFVNTMIFHMSISNEFRIPCPHWYLRISRLFALAGYCQWLIHSFNDLGVYGRCHWIGYSGFYRTSNELATQESVPQFPGTVRRHYLVHCDRFTCPYACILLRFFSNLPSVLFLPRVRIPPAGGFDNAGGAATVNYSQATKV